MRGRHIYTYMHSRPVLHHHRPTRLRKTMNLHSVSNILVLLLAALTSNASFIPRQAASSSDGAGLGPDATLSTADPTGGGGVYGPGATAGIASPSTTPTATGTTSPSTTDRPGLSTADPTGGGGVFGPGATDPTPSSQTRSYNFYPSGIQKGSGTIEAALPLECSQYCLMPAGAYLYVTYHAPVYLK